MYLSLYYAVIVPSPPKSTLFPYTTLFRSTGRPSLRFHPPVAGEPSSPASEASRAQAPPTTPGPPQPGPSPAAPRSEEHTSELQSLRHLVCRLLLEKKKTNTNYKTYT